MKYKFPAGFKPATLAEREKYYSLKFDVKKVISWLTFRPDKPFIVIDFGTESGICKNEYRDNLGSYFRINNGNYSTLHDRLLEYIPEDIYYNRNIYENQEKCSNCSLMGENCSECNYRIGQEFVIDIDPDDIECPFCAVSQKLSDFDFCDYCMEKSLEYTIKTINYLRKKKFEDIQTVFSGRGFHIHVKDRDAFYLSKNKRREIFTSLLQEGIITDKSVAIGKAYLIRLPYSLHGLTSKIVTPLSKKQLVKNEIIRISTFQL